MATAQMDTVVRHLRRAVLRYDAAGWMKYIRWQRSASPAEPRTAPDRGGASDRGGG